MKRHSVAVLLLVALCAPAAAGETGAAPSPGPSLESLWTLLDSVVKVPLSWWETLDSRAAGSEVAPPTEKGPDSDPIGLQTIESDQPPTEKGPDIDPIGLQTIGTAEPPTEKGPSSDPWG